MGRSNRPKRRGVGGGPHSGGGASRAPDPFEHLVTPEVEYAGQTWAVRQVRGNDSGRSYLCPGCQQYVAAHEAHTVVWPVQGMRGMENRRHWHRRCWQRRERWTPGGSWA